VGRQWSAKPLFSGSNPDAASSFSISFRQIERLAWMKGMACRIFELPFLPGSQWRPNEASLEWLRFDSDRPPPGVSPSEALISTKYRIAISRQCHPE
jgi:hypothetical protein